MEGHVIERRTSTVHAWTDARQSTLPSTSTTAVPAYSNIFVTPPSEAEIQSRKTPDGGPSESAPAKMQIKDRHDGTNYVLMYSKEPILGCGCEINED